MINESLISDRITFDDQADYGLKFALSDAAVEWDFFGNRSLLIQLNKPISRWKRFFCWVALGSKFRDLK